MTKYLLIGWLSTVGMIVVYAVLNQLIETMPAIVATVMTFTYLDVAESMILGTIAGGGIWVFVAVMGAVGGDEYP
jgi:hypothetical protein